MKERGEALLETVLVVPLLLMVGLIAAEFGMIALRRAQLSESIRSTINLELLAAENSTLIKDRHSLELTVERKLKALPGMSKDKPLVVRVTYLYPDERAVTELPFESFERSRVYQNHPQEFEIRVKVQSEGLFNSNLELPPLVDVVRYRMRG